MGSYNFLLVCHGCLHWFEVACYTPELWGSWSNKSKDWKRRCLCFRTSPLGLVPDPFVVNPRRGILSVQQYRIDRFERCGRFRFLCSTSFSKIAMSSPMCLNLSWDHLKIHTRALFNFSPSGDVPSPSSVSTGFTNTPSPRLKYWYSDFGAAVSGVQR